MSICIFSSILREHDGRLSGKTSGGLYPRARFRSDGYLYIERLRSRQRCNLRRSKIPTCTRAVLKVEFVI